MFRRVGAMPVALRLKASTGLGRLYRDKLTPARLEYRDGRACYTAPLKASRKTLRRWILFAQPLNDPRPIANIGCFPSQPYS